MASRQQFPLLYKAALTGASDPRQALTGQRRLPSGTLPYPVPKLINTVNGASDTNLKSAVAGSGAFDTLAVGDVLVFNLKGATLYRRITVVTNDNLIVVGEAINLPVAGQTFSFLRLVSAENLQADFRPGTLYVETVGGITVTVEARVSGEDIWDVIVSSLVCPTNVITAVEINGNYDFVRYAWVAGGATVVTAIFRDAYDYTSAFITGEAPV